MNSPNNCASATVWPDGQIVFSIFGHSQQRKFTQNIQIVPKWVHNFAKYQKPLNIWTKISQFVAKAVKFRQIWSHWLQQALAEA